MLHVLEYLKRGQRRKQQLTSLQLPRSPLLRNSLACFSTIASHAWPGHHILLVDVRSHLDVSVYPSTPTSPFIIKLATSCQAIPTAHMAGSLFA